MTLTMEQAAAICCPRPLILREPCESCGERFTVRDEPPYAVCRRGDFECEALRELEVQAAWASELATVIARQHKPDVRKAEAESSWGVLDDMLTEMHGRPALDEREFMRLCGVTS